MGTSQISFTLQYDKYLGRFELLNSAVTWSEVVNNFARMSKVSEKK